MCGLANWRRLGPWKHARKYYQQAASVELGSRTTLLHLVCLCTHFRKSWTMTLIQKCLTHLHFLMQPCLLFTVASLRHTNFLHHTLLKLMRSETRYWRRYKVDRQILRILPTHTKVYQRMLLLRSKACWMWMDRYGIAGGRRTMRKGYAVL